MSNKKIACTVKGISPLLMHAYPLIPQEAPDKKSPEEQAEFGAYRDPDTGDLYIPSAAIQRALVSGATYCKGKGRATLQKPVAACVLVSPERCSLGVKTFKVDSRGVVIPATRGRIVRHRPRLDDWSVSFDIEFDDTLLTEAEMRRVMDETISRVGFLDFRPEKKGPFGRSMVVKWE